MKHSKGNKVYSLFQCQWTTDVSDTEHIWGKTESSPAFAAASCVYDSTRQNGHKTHCMPALDV